MDDEEVEESDIEDVGEEEVSGREKYAERQAEIAEKEAAKQAKYAENQENEAEEEVEAPEPDEDADLEAVQPLDAIPEEFKSLKSPDKSLKWWAVLIIVVGSVLLVAGLVLVVVFKCNAEYQMLRDKALSCCGVKTADGYEPVKTAEE